MSDRRLIFLDALRGFFILYVVWLHATIGVVFNNDPQALNTLPKWLLIVFAPVMILATWAPIFVVISGAANAYVLHNVMKRHQEKQGTGVPFRSFMAGSLVTGIFLYSLSIFNMTFMHHSMNYNGSFQHTLFTGSLHEGSWQSFSPDLLFYNDALSLVAISGILINLLLYVLWSGNGFNRMQRTVKWIAAVAAGVLLTSPIVHSILSPVFFNALNNSHYGMAFALKLFIGPNLSVIPFLSYGLVGALIGIGLARRVPASLFRRYGYGVAAFMVVAGAGLFMVQEFSPTQIALHPQPLKIHLVNLGLMLACCTFLVLHMEYCSEEKRARVALRTLWFRRVGLMALTLFCLESLFAVLFSNGYLWTLGIEGPFPRSPWVIIPYVVCILVFWNLVLKAWEKTDFKYGVEWWMSWLVCIVRNRPTVRLQADEVLHKPCTPITPDISKPQPVLK